MSFEKKKTFNLALDSFFTHGFNATISTSEQKKLIVLQEAQKSFKRVRPFLASEPTTSLIM